MATRAAHHQEDTMTSATTYPGNAPYEGYSDRDEHAARVAVGAATGDLGYDSITGVIYQIVRTYGTVHTDMIGIGDYVWADVRLIAMDAPWLTEGQWDALVTVYSDAADDEVDA